MEVQNDYLIEAQSCGKFIYVEPNAVNNGKNIPIPLEDLSVYVELRVQYNQTQSKVVKDNNGNEYILQMKMNNGTNNKVSLYNGISDNSNNIFLSTESYDKYTLNGLTEGKSEELFGVESIDISYNSYAVPEVVIKFIDIKGAALHGAEELAHTTQTDGDENNYSPTSKFLSCFFTVPYPRFEMVVKGFYGKPVFYDLTCADLRSSFNANSGNYDVTVKMVGYSFALISDITMCSLMAAPKSKYHGRSYWGSTDNGFYFANGKKFPTLQELVFIWRNNLANVYETQDGEQKDVRNILSQKTKYERVKEIILQFILAINNNENGLNKYFKSYSNAGQDGENSKYIIFLTQEGYNEVFPSDSQQQLLINNVWNYNLNQWLWNPNPRYTLEQLIKPWQEQIKGVLGGNSINLLDLINPTKWYEGEANVENKLCTYALSLQTNDGFELNSELEYCMTDILLLYINQCDNTILNSQDNYNRYKYQKEASIINKISEELGFQPTLENITKICFAHLETLLYMFNKVSGSTNNTEECFPMVYNKRNISNTIYEEEDWAMSLPNGSERQDVQMVYGLSNGLTQMVTDEILITQNSGEDHIYLSAIDIFLDKHPWKDKINGGKIDIDVVRQRYMQLINFGEDRWNYPDRLKTLGVYDARMYRTLFKNQNSQISQNINDLLTSYQIKTWNGNYLENLSEPTNFSPINWYDPQNSTIYNKKIYTSGDTSDVITLNIDAGWASACFPNNQRQKYFADDAAIIVPKATNQNQIQTVEYTTQKLGEGDSEHSVVWGMKDNDGGWLFERNGQNYVNNRVTWDVPNRNDVTFLKLSEMLSSGNYTLLAIPSFDMSAKYEDSEKYIKKSSWNEGSLFRQEYYKKADIYGKATMFLYTFFLTHENDGRKVEDLICEYVYTGKDTLGHILAFIKPVPYFYLLLIGAALYFKVKHKEYLINTKQTYDITPVDMGSTTSYGEARFMIDLGQNASENAKDKIDRLYEKYATQFINLFETWVNNYYEKWDGAIFSGDNINKEMHYASIKIGSDDNPKYLDLFRETHPYVQEMTQQFFSLKWFIMFPFDYRNPTLQGIGSSQNNTMGVFGEPTLFQDKWEKYFTAFYETLSELYGEEIDREIREFFSASVSSKEYINFNIYRYAKQIWDRWVLNGNGYNQWKMNDVFNGNTKRIHFIDPSYNDVGQSVFVDMGKFIELLESCIEQEDLPFLSFLSYFYRDNNCTLTNVQNFINGQKEENVKQLFKPISVYDINWETDYKPYSDLVVLFSYQASSSLDDSFNINDYDLPSHYRGSSSQIPSFGVAYGMQNQNYFTDINVSMDTPNVTDQSIQAIMQIAEENNPNGGNDTSIKMRSLSQDMYKVYSSHAYQCSVTMMGCAWIQPLMYFQLLNIPLFRGAYIIHKVTHTISPNNMVTKFIGTKISKASVKRLDIAYYLMEMDRIQTSYQLYESALASYDNNCNYAYFSPYGEDSTVDDMYKGKILNHLNSLYGEYETDYATYYAWILRRSQRNLVMSRFSVHCDVLFHNLWVKNRNNINDFYDFFDGLFNKYNDIFYLNDRSKEKMQEDIVSDSGYTETRNGLIMCFSDINGFMQYTGLFSASTSSNRNYGQIEDMTMVNNQYESNTEVTILDKKIAFLCDSPPIDYFNLRVETNSSGISLSNIVTSFNSTLRQVNTCQGIELEVNKESGLDYVVVKQESVSDDQKAQIFDMILQTYYSHLDSLLWVVDDSHNGNKMWNKLYVDLVSPDTIYFDVQVVYHDGADLRGINIQKGTGNFHINFYQSLIKRYGFIKGGEGNFQDCNFSLFNKECLNFKHFEKKELLLDAFNSDDNIKNITIKDCDELISDKISELSNGGKMHTWNRGSRVLDEDCGVDGDMNTITDAQKNARNDGSRVRNSEEDFDTNFQNLDNCESFYGSLKPDSKKEMIISSQKDLIIHSTINDNIELALMRNGLQPLEEKATAYATVAFKDSNPNSKGQCTRGVRMALEKALTFNGSNNWTDMSRPNSACRYWRILEHWGWRVHWEGNVVSSKNPDGYEPKDGDIVVTAGLNRDAVGLKQGGAAYDLDAKRHGHIQIYYKSKWYCDTDYTNLMVYSNSSRYCIIYRVPSGDNGFQTISINEYSPSDKIIENIKNFEGFMPLWYEDSSSYSIGYGFLESDYLKNSKWARTSANTCTEENKWEVFGKELDNDKYPGCMTKNDANTYMETLLLSLNNEFKNIMRNKKSYSSNQYDALFSLFYNIGAHSFQNSPNLMYALDIGYIENIIKEMNHGWDNPGVQKRRKWEQELFKTNIFPPFPS